MINTVTLCGSTRFAADFAECNRELTKRGLSVITISFAAEKEPNGLEKERGVKELLDLVHFNKILRSNAIVIVGDGYIGFSTAREIIWAQMQDKPILHQRYNNNKANYDELMYLITTSHCYAEIWVAKAIDKLRELDASK